MPTSEFNHEITGAPLLRHSNVTQRLPFSKITRLGSAFGGRQVLREIRSETRPMGDTLLKPPDAAGAAQASSCFKEIVPLYRMAAAPFEPCARHRVLCHLVMSHSVTDCVAVAMVRIDKVCRSLRL